MELKANELRLGNLTNVGKVIEIQEDYFYVHDGESSLKSSWFEIKPIPLTEEWLLKFGFKHIMNNWYNLHVNGNTFNVYIFENGRYRVEIVSQSIGVFEFVHTLQNLFYSIGGKELEIKM